MEGEIQRRHTNPQTDKDGVPRQGLSGGTVPGDPLQGSTHEEAGSPAVGNQEERMRRLEEGVDAPGSGVLGKGIHVGTPAGGVTEAARTGSAHWGEPRQPGEPEEEDRAA